jgi:GAF domain-containing protein
LLCLHDLRDQPKALPVYLERHGLRGLALVPLQQTPNNPLGLLSLGYRAPLAPLSGRTTALAHGLARMVAVALERERSRAEAQECA